MPRITQELLFSEAVLRIGPTGLMPLPADESTMAGSIGNVVVASSCERKDACGANGGDVDSAIANAKGSISFAMPEANRLLLPYVAGMAKTTEGSVDIFTLSKTSQPVACRIELDCKDGIGKNVKIVAANAKAKGFSIGPTPRPITFDCYPDKDGDVITRTS